MPKRLSKTTEGAFGPVTDYDLIAFSHTYAGGVKRQRVAAAVITGGRVKVVVWTVDADGHLVDRFESDPGIAATSVGIARCGSMSLATTGGEAIPLFAVAAGAKETWASFYAVGQNGVLGPFDDMGGVVPSARSIRGPQSLGADIDSDVHFAMIDTAGRLCIAGFKWAQNDGQLKGPFFTGQAVDAHGTVTSFSAAKLSATQLVTITQSKTEPRAKVIVWQEGVNPWQNQPGVKSTVFDRLCDSGDFMGKAGEVAVSSPEDGSGQFLTAYQTAAQTPKRLKLHTWRSTGKTVVEMANSGELAPVKAVDVAVLRTLAGGGYRAVTATTDTEDRLTTTSWKVAPSGAITHVAASQPIGEATRVRVARLSDASRFVTVSTNASGGLKVITWQDDA